MTPLKTRSAWKGYSLNAGRERRLAAGLARAALSACLFACGCVSAPSDSLSSSVAHPIVGVTRNGITFQGRPVTPEESVRLLEKNGVPKDRTLHVLVDDDFDDQKILWVFKHNYLDRAGYTKSVWIHGRRGESGRSDIKPPEGGVTMPYRPRTHR